MEKKEFLLRTQLVKAENDEWYIELEGGLRIVVSHGKIDGYYFTSGPISKEEKMAEAFERIAFEAAKERDAIKYAFCKGYDTCDICLNNYEGENCEESDCDCGRYGYANCVCKSCIENQNSEFVIDMKKAKKLLEGK